MVRSDPNNPRLTFILRLTLSRKPDGKTATDANEEAIMGKLHCIETGTEATVVGFDAIRGSILIAIAMRRAAAPQPPDTEDGP